MIITITGNIAYPITLDPSVWIFDERKILFEEAFIKQRKQKIQVDEAKQTAERLNRAYHEKIRPPVNKGMNKAEREQVLKNSYVMPLHEFIDYTEPNESATSVKLKTSTGDIDITLEQLESALLLFSIKGKQILNDGPVYLYFKDGSNKHSPIKGIKEIIIN